MGWNINYSVSPAMHNAAFRALGMHDWFYDLVPVPPDIVRSSLKTLREEGGFIGVNVTQPLKQLVMPHVRGDALVQAVGAVNTIDLRNLHATNTDVIGLIDDLKANGVMLEGARAVVLGAGGAARAAVYGLLQEGAEILIVNRTQDRAYQLAADMKISGDVVSSFREAAEWSPTLIINCTTVGTYPHIEESPWAADVPFPRGVVAYDMVYRPELTAFMRQAEKAGGRAGGGLGMLVRQGAASFKIWTGATPPLEVMLEAAHEALRGQ